jgi:2-dehydro-3-deoxy-D-arabinonate dehydratase
LAMKREAMQQMLASAARQEPAGGQQLAPIDPQQEVWAAGVTYLRSREARRAESAVANVYAKVYNAPRPELFFKSIGWRVVGSGMPIRIRRDSRWNVPEPEMVVVANCFGEVVGYCAGNDMSSRDIEGENPLYLPQAKIYNGSCALGNGIVLCDVIELTQLAIRLQIHRQGRRLFEGETTTAQMKRPVRELIDYLQSELDFPHGVLLMTGTGIVPADEFSLQPADVITVQVGSAKIENHVQGGTP